MGTVISIIFIAIFIITFLLGFFGGFGKVLTFASKGLLGTIVSIIICYNIFGLVSSIGFINQLLTSFRDLLIANPNFFTKVLLIIRIDMIALAVALYFIIKLLIWLLAKLIESIMEADNIVVKIINKVLGVIGAWALTLMAIFLIFQILSIIPIVNSAVEGALSTTFLRLDVLYNINPLNAIIDLLFGI